MSDNKNEIYKKLREMSVSERIKYLKDAGITKEKIIDHFKNSKFIGKFLIIKQLNKMSDVEFFNMVAGKIDMIPLSMLNKYED